MSGGKRTDRVAGQVHAALAEVLSAGAVRDPRIVALSIVRVRMSDDLRIARVNIVPLGGSGDARELLAGLEAAGGFLRREVGRRVRTRYTPELRFHLDESVEGAMRITRLLDDLADERIDEPFPAEEPSE